ncbi:MAG: carboxypeptidase regulatory-like domain-containing protein [Gemmatimonadales bacterium]|nr:carboxypeptidase regulatory-like domain-containing protein [Gemmatimonadales bacterium]
MTARITFALAALAATTPAAAQSIRGVVKDMNNAPLPNAEVRLNELNRSLFTNARGEFRFDGLKPRRYSLLARIPGYSAGRMTLEIKDTASVDVEISLNQIPQALENIVVEGKRRGLYGKVGDNAFRLISGAKVTVHGAGTSAITDSVGQFGFPKIQTGKSYAVSVEFPGHIARPLFVDIPPGGSKEVVIVINPTPSGYRVPNRAAWAMRDLGTRLAFNSRWTRMTAEELRKSKGKSLCDIPRIRSTIRREDPILIVNGYEVIRDWPLCEIEADDLELVEWGTNCKDASGGVGLLLGTHCEGPRDTFDRWRGGYGQWVMIWTRR